MKYSKQITKVHDEFNLAGETLLKEAEEYLESIKIPNESKVERLKKLGFIRSKEVVETEEIIVEEPEECDDGEATDQCTDECTKTYCGDGIIQDPNGYDIDEVCDGENLGEHDCTTVPPLGTL